MKDKQVISPAAILLLRDFEKQRKISEKARFESPVKRLTICTTNHVEIVLKSGKEYHSEAYSSYLVMKYPTPEEPLVKIAHFLNHSDRVFKFPSKITSIPLESIESISFMGSGKAGFVNYNKNKGVL